MVVLDHSALVRIWFSERVQYFLFYEGDVVSEVVSDVVSAVLSLIFLVLRR